MMPFVQSTTSNKIEVTHVLIDSTKPFANVQAYLEALIPPIDPEVYPLRPGISDLKQRLEALPELVVLAKRDHGLLLGIYGQPRHAVQYEIGNPLTASTMTRYGLAASLYAPLRVVLYENDNGGSRFEYDLPSSLFGQFGDDRITGVARGLDNALHRTLTAAAE